MYYELIYTRCRNGIDLTSKRRVPADGIRVADCSKEMLEDVSLDMALISNAAGLPACTSNPNYPVKDDAYTFYSPDRGAGIMVDYHEVPFDANKQTDYANRPGNYINQLLIGDFREFYPFELFGDEAIWTARQHDESYYYSIDRAELPARETVEPAGSITVDEVRAFVEDGRKDALKKCVAFLLSQYELDSSKRKYLIIQDDSAKSIELWIAAIELAFSPRMAAGLPFATRMTDFMKNNRYAVNEQGAFQPQINMQDPRLSIRFRAMIIGVHLSDKSTASSIKNLPASPYVILDGKNKKALFDADISSAYYSTITEFDEKHIYYSRELLQSFQIDRPSNAVFDMLPVLELLLNKDSATCDDILAMINEVSRYEMYPTKTLKRMYHIVHSKLPEFLDSDAISLMRVVNWTRSAGTKLGVKDTYEQLAESVNNMLEQALYGGGRDVRFAELWQAVRSSDFLKEAARMIVDHDRIEKNSDTIKSFSSKHAAEFFGAYCDSVKCIGDDKKTLETVIGDCAIACSAEQNKSNLAAMIQHLRGLKGADAENTILRIVSDCSSETANFVVRFLAEQDQSLSKIAGFDAFCKRLADAGLSSQIGIAVELKLKAMRSNAEMEEFARAVPKMKSTDQLDLPEFFKAIDKKMDIMDRGAVSLARAIQECRPNDAVCENSAHVMALNEVGNKKRLGTMESALQRYVDQGFPSVADPSYVDALMQSVMKARPNQRDGGYLSRLFYAGPDIYAFDFFQKLIPAASKEQDLWNSAMTAASEIKDNKDELKTKNTLLRALLTCDVSKRNVGNLEKLIMNPRAKEYFAQIADDALSRLEGFSRSPFDWIKDKFGKK